MLNEQEKIENSYKAQRNQ